MNCECHIVTHLHSVQPQRITRTIHYCDRHSEANVATLEARCIELERDCEALRREVRAVLTRTAPKEADHG